MTSKPDQNPKGRTHAKGRGVLDPAWEEELERGRAADDEAPDAGSIEPELAMLHLLRHAREPESLSPVELDDMWSDISQAVAPERSWLSRLGAAFSGQWARWLMPVAGAAAIVLIFQNGGSSEDAAPAVAMESKAEPTAAPGGPTAQDAAREADNKDANESAPPAAQAAKTRANSGSTAAVLEQQFSLLEARGREKVDSSVQTQRTSLRSALIGQARGGAK